MSSKGSSKRAKKSTKQVTKKTTTKVVKKTKKQTVSKKGLPKVRMKFTNRRLSPGLGRAVAKRTYLRTDENGKLEKWSGSRASLK